MANEENQKADANPTKKFFVNMITRDITVEDSILDLIDNSVDGAWGSVGGRPMSLADTTDLSPYSISITVSPQQFTIKDNCGGMSLDAAASYAFSFGRRDSVERADYSIGVYGIGMKRAVFKLGKDIRIRSTFKDTDGSTLAFAVPIAVTDWLKTDDPPWDFDIDDDEQLDEHGVEIVVRELTPGAKTSFGNPAFAENLRRTIARDYTLHLERGLKVSVNDKFVRSVPIKLRRSTELVPMRLKYTDRQNGDEVSVEIIGGMAAAPPDSPDPDDKDDSEKRYGWYVACNGRIVLAADKTSVSGWGTSEWPQWHGQYSGFLGIVFFSARNTAALPLTTTKRSVDATSEIFQRARPKMREVSKHWIAYTNARKQALEAAKSKEEEATAVSIRVVENRPAAKLPTLLPTQMEPLANVNYSVPVSRMKKLAKGFGSITMPYREVGLKSFDYTYEDFVGDE